MSILWRLVRKDLLRDFRHPWELLIYMVIPVLTALLMSLVFAPGSDFRENITLHVAQGIGVAPVAFESLAVA